MLLMMSRSFAGRSLWTKPKRCCSPLLNNQEFRLAQHSSQFRAPATQAMCTGAANENLSRLLLNEFSTFPVKPAAIGVQDGESVRKMSEGDRPQILVILSRKTRGASTGVSRSK